MSTCEARGGRECRGRGWGQGPGRHSAVLADLPGSQSHFGVLGLAELRQLLEDGRQLVRQRGVTAAELVLQSTMVRLGPLAAGVAASRTGNGDKTQGAKMAKCCSLNHTQRRRATEGRSP